LESEVEEEEAAPTKDQLAKILLRHQTATLTMTIIKEQWWMTILVPQALATTMD